MEAPVTGNATFETITVEQRDAVTLITLNRPQAINALNSQVLEDLIGAFTAFEANPGQCCAVQARRTTRV